MVEAHYKATVECLNLCSTLPPTPLIVKLEFIEVKNCRNLIGRVVFDAELNILFGDNGQGKTNWLEAIYILANRRSFRTSHLHEVIRHEEKEAILRGQINLAGGISRELSISIGTSRRLLFTNGKRVKTEEYAEQLGCFSLTMADLDVIRGAPEARRGFLDKCIISLKGNYLTTITTYNHILKQKNRLLHEISVGRIREERAKEQVDSWNIELISRGAIIHRERINFVATLNNKLKRNLFGHEEIHIRYRSSFEGKGDLENYAELFAERLQYRYLAEIAAGYSLIGPHRDDLEIRFDGVDIRAFGSAGQQRSALIILDLAAIEAYYDGYQEYPLLLIDDIDAELDEKRIDKLLDYLVGRTQTFITTTKSVVRRLAKTRIYLVENGKAEEEMKRRAIS